MKNFEEIIFNEFITRFNVSPDIALWSDEVLEEWLKINLETSNVFRYGTKRDKKELITLYKSEVINKNKRLHLVLIENEGVFDTAPPTPQRRFFIYAD